MLNFLFNALNALGSEWVLWLLGLLSILSVALIIERFKTLGKEDNLGFRLWDEYVEQWMKNPETIKSDKKQNFTTAYPCVEGQVVELIKSSEQPKEKLELTIQSLITKERLRLEKNVSFLGTLGANAPFIGLLGTVLGIIRAFYDLGIQGQDAAGAQSISLGLSEALVATAVGLFVAIPAVLAFNHFQRKIKKVVGRAESLANFLIGQR